MPSRDKAVIIRRHGQSQCWLVLGDDNSWMHFGPPEMTEEEAKAVVMENVPDCSEVWVFPHGRDEAKNN